jgi:hypothetical protein
MNIDLNHLEFKLHTDPAYFNVRMNEMLGEVGNQLPAGIEFDPVIQKCRWILTELITNAYKHSGKEEILLRVQFYPSHLSIVKEDGGVPLNFNLPNGKNICWPLSHLYFDREFDIFSDQLNILNVQINGKGNVLFSVRQSPSTESAHQKMNEHFGLIIIASVCSEFTYTYEPETGRNIFKTTISY